MFPICSSIGKTAPEVKKGALSWEFPSGRGKDETGQSVAGIDAGGRRGARPAAALGHLQGLQTPRAPRPREGGRQARLRHAAPGPPPEIQMHPLRGKGRGGGEHGALSAGGGEVDVQLLQFCYYSLSCAAKAPKPDGAAGILHPQ